MATKKSVTYSLAFDREAARAGLSLDERGLFPIERARAIVAAAEAYTRDGPPPGDTIWVSLLSLADAAEFCREASRLEWRFAHLRGWKIEDAVLRFGAGALPWVESMLDRNQNRVGSIPPAPFYFVGTHLLAIGPEAVKAVLRADRDSDADPDGLGFVNDWLARHGSAAWGALATLALDGDARARSVLDVLARRSPSGVKKHLVASLGKATAARAVGNASLAASTILAVLDAAASAEIGDRVPWPTLIAGVGHFEYHGMRVVAVRAKKGDDWGILIEVVQGDILAHGREVRWPATIQQYTYGSKVPSGGVYLEDARALTLRPNKPDAHRIAALDLREGRSITGAVEDGSSVLAIRAQLATDPDALFPPAKKVAAKLGIRGAEILLDVRALQHVDGPRHGRDALAQLPSQSPSWKSIAEVIVTRDPSRFDAGVPNTDWRQHAR